MLRCMTFLDVSLVKIGSKNLRGLTGPRSNKSWAAFPSLEVCLEKIGTKSLKGLTGPKSKKSWAAFPSLEVCLEKIGRNVTPHGAFGTVG